MASSKKYNCRVTQDDTNWTAEIVRRKTARESVISKSQTGFASEAEAEAWGQEALKGFLKTEADKKKKRI